MKQKWMKSNTVVQIFKYVVVGVINTVIDLAVLYLLIAIFHRGSSGPYYTLFKAISFIVAVINSYFLNKYWAFAGSGNKKSASKEGVQFAITSLVGWVINVSIATIFINTIPVLFGLTKLWPAIGALSGTVLGLVWNYFGYRFLVFRDEKPELLPPA